MKKLVIAIICITCMTKIFSQTVTDRVYIKGDWREMMNTIYLYENFKPGLILFKNGQRYFKPINYNRFLSTVEYLEKNDTLLLADESTVNAVIVDNDVFFFTPACLRTIYNGKVKLYKYEKNKMGDIQKIGAMGIPNTSSSIQTVDRIDANSRSYYMADIGQTVIVSRATTWLIETPDHQFVPASKKNFLRAHAAKQGEIQQYIKSNNTNFNKEQDLMALVKYTESLTN